MFDTYQDCDKAAQKARINVMLNALGIITLVSVLAFFPPKGWVGGISLILAWFISLRTVVDSLSLERAMKERAHDIWVKELRGAQQMLREIAACEISDHELRVTYHKIVQDLGSRGTSPKVQFHLLDALPPERGIKLLQCVLGPEL